MRLLTPQVFACGIALWLEGERCLKSRLLLGLSFGTVHLQFLFFTLPFLFLRLLCLKCFGFISPVWSLWILSVSRLPVSSMSSMSLLVVFFLTDTVWRVKQKEFNVMDHAWRYPINHGVCKAALLASINLKTTALCLLLKNMMSQIPRAIAGDHLKEMRTKERSLKSCFCAH